MNMRERIAEALSRANTGGAASWRLWLDDADAVLEALREPTEEITEQMRNVSGAGYPYSPGPIPPLGYMQVAVLWRAGIDAARQ